MPKIKTRETEKGSIKTIDRASAMMKHMKKADFRLKNNMPSNRSDIDNASNYAQQNISLYGRKAIEKASSSVYKGSKRAVKRIRRKQDVIGIKKRKDILFRSRHFKQSTKTEEARMRSAGRTNISKPNANISKVQSDNIMPMHSAKIKTPTEAQKKTAIYSKAMTEKAEREVALKSSYKVKAVAERTAKGAKKSAKRIAENTRRLFIATRTLIVSIGVAGSAAIGISIICILFGAAFYFFGDDSSSYESVSPEVEAYTPIIEKYATEYDIPQYVELIKAVMMQESGGKGTDPMQASECKYNTKYPKKPNAIKDPEYSIKCGIQYLRDNLKAAKAESPVDMDRIKLALQGYNFGSGYISWALNRYGGYSYAGAIEFSKEQAEKHGWDSYGDPNYVEHVLRYYPFGNYTYDVINTGSGKLGLPIEGMTSANISSHFGHRVSPGGIGTTYHEGLDIAFPTGTKVLACEAGTVTVAGWNGGLGKCIIIQHEDSIQTVYGHLSEINVRTGQKVVRGQVIGKVGNTGNSTGPHLHIGIKYGDQFVNPEKGWFKLD